MIYAVDKRTKEHRIAGEFAYCGNHEVLIEADADGWIEWRGGECPLPYGERVELIMRGHGETYTPTAYTNHQRWTNRGHYSDIIAYRPIIDAPKPEWNGEGLPPVGSVCECSLDFNAGKEGTNWNKIEVLYADESTVVGRIIEGAHTPSFSNGFETNVYEFRPIRTDRERWIDDAMSMSDCPDNAPLIRQYFEAIHDALRNGELPMPEGS